jgi:hypothetical protein
MKSADAQVFPHTETASQDAFCSLDIHNSLNVDVYGSHDHPVFSDLPRASGYRLTRAPISWITFEERVAGEDPWNGWDDETFMYLDGLISLPLSAATSTAQFSITDDPAPPAPHTWGSPRTSMFV